MMLEISEAELNTRKIGGVVIICRSCKNNKNKIMMLQYTASDSVRGIHFQFCDECMKLMGVCIPCNAKKKPI